MRIIAGKWRGRVVDAPKNDATRPTTDRVRESIASAVWSDRGGFEGLSVLDAFAGSGAMALEMLSRGAAHATFCDTNPQALKCIRDNVARMGATEREARVLRCDVLTSPAGKRLVGSPFDVVVLDPPYACDAKTVVALVEKMGLSGSLTEDALIVHERSVRGQAMESVHLDLASTRSFGSTAVDMFHWRSSPDVERTDDSDHDAENLSAVGGKDV